MDMKSIGQALQGFGAGHRGGGGELLAQRARADEIKIEKDRQHNADRRFAMLSDNRITFDHLKNGRVSDAITHMKNRLPLIEQLGGDPFDTLERIQKLEDGDIDFVMNDASNTDRAAVLGGELDKFPEQVTENTGLASAKTQFWDNGTIAQAMPNGETQVRNPRGDIVTGDERVAALKLARKEQVEFAGKEAGAKEEAKLRGQLILKPEVEAAVLASTRAATAAADQSQEGRSNAKALSIYQASIGGLSDALGKTYTGPFAGMMKAITSNQQGADSAIAAMVPALKSVFRGAGEGTFSDGDRDALIAMLPTREMRPAARASAINNINTIVMAKLSAAPDSGGGAKADAGPQEITTQAGFDALPSGSVYLEGGVEHRKP
jgi:hypothetical protein